MGGKKKHAKQSQNQSVQKNNKTAQENRPQTQLAQKKKTEEKQPAQGKRFVNLLPVYTIYKQKFRRISKEEYEVILRHGNKGKRKAKDLCQEFMKAKNIIENEVSFEKNVGFLSLPRFLPLVALLAERAEYKMRLSLVKDLVFTKTPARFRDKFAHLMVYGFWYLGRVISDSLSVKEQVNRGNMFSFEKGDLGFWWAGVRILDWNCYVYQEKYAKSCHWFVVNDPRKYRLYTSNAILNMHQHPLYFLSDLDWINYKATVKAIHHKKARREVEKPLPIMTQFDLCSDDDDDESYLLDSDSMDGSMDGSYISYESMDSLNTVASRETVD